MLQKSIIGPENIQIKKRAIANTKLLIRKNQAKKIKWERQVIKFQNLLVQKIFFVEAVWTQNNTTHVLLNLASFFSGAFQKSHKNETCKYILHRIWMSRNKMKTQFQKLQMHINLLNRGAICLLICSSPPNGHLSNALANRSRHWIRHPNIRPSLPFLYRQSQ